MAAVYLYRSSNADLINFLNIYITVMRDNWSPDGEID